MARKTANLVPAAVVGVLAVVLLGGGVWWLSRTSTAPAAPPVTAPPLPAGRLRFLAANLTDARYLVADSVVRTDGRVEATILVVGRTPAALDRQFALMTRRETVDCKARMIRNETAAAFDVDARRQNLKILTGPTGRAFDSVDAEAPLLCAGPSEPKGRFVAGYKAAQHEAQSPPDDIVKRAEATPDDPHGWAWLCATAAQAHWRPESPKDCDRAVRLAPDQAAPLIDRAVLNTKIGKFAAAEADFRKALALEPGEPVALFGRAMLNGMRGQKAASLRDKDLAIAADPTVAAWVQTAYGFLIPDEYRR